MPNWTRDDGTSCFNDETNPAVVKPTEAVPRRLSDDDKARAVAEWKAANGYDDLIAAYADSVTMVSTLRAQRDEARARLRHIGSIVGNIDEATMHHAVARAEVESRIYREAIASRDALRAQRDEARELVRMYNEWCKRHQVGWVVSAREAAARWDEEEKR